MKYFPVVSNFHPVFFYSFLDLVADAENNCLGKTSSMRIDCSATYKRKTGADKMEMGVWKAVKYVVIRS